MTTGWEPLPHEQPLPPKNGTVYAPYMRGALDIRWDSPNLLAGNSKFTVVGVNIYRSDVSDRGPYYRLNENPIGGTFYRDQTEISVVWETVDWATGWAFKGDAPSDPRWVLRTKNPIYKKGSVDIAEPVFANSPVDVILVIDNVIVPVMEVFGPNGEVTLFKEGVFDPLVEKVDKPIRPGPDSVVEICYHTLRNRVVTNLARNLFYRITTVVLDPEAELGFRETDLNYCQTVQTTETETLDYIWREAVRRNAWIAQQGGERVKVFIRRTTGIPCSCGIEDRTREFSKQPSNRCRVCFGTGFLNPYEGPYDILVSPADSEQKITQTMHGRRNEFTYEVWTGPSPVITQRDFIVKQTNERYSVGPVRRPTNRGNLLQQHFNMALLDDGDIRYSVPIYGLDGQKWPQTRYNKRPVQPPPAVGNELRGPEWMADPNEVPHETGPVPVAPLGTEKAEWSDEFEQRGRTAVWENINRGHGK